MFYKAETGRVEKNVFIRELEQMRPRLLLMAQNWLEDDTEAEDLVQDAMLKLWKIRDESIRHPDSLAHVIVRNLCIDRLRKRSRVEYRSFMDDFLAEPNPSKDERISRLMSLINQLPVMQQTVMRMRHTQEMEIPDIAELLGISEVAVRMSLSRARKRLMNMYNKQYPLL